MTKTQLIVLWVGIGVLVLMGLFPTVTLSRLCTEWAIVIMLTGGLIYSLKFDPDLMLKIPCLLFSLLHNLFPLLFKRSYQEILKDAKEGKHNLIVFWVIVLILLLFVLIAIRLSIPIRGRGVGIIR
jgi:hypothetical protein